MLQQMRGQAGTEAAGPFNSPHATTRRPLASKLQQVGITRSISSYRQMRAKPSRRCDERGRMRVLVGIDPDDEIDPFGEHDPGGSSRQAPGLALRTARRQDCDGSRQRVGQASDQASIGTIQGLVATGRQV